jgi:hypothetical protein
MLFRLAALADFILFILHIAAIFIGYDAYIFLRAGRVMAEAAQSGAMWPAYLTLVVASVFLAWSFISFWASTDAAHSILARKLVLAIGIVFLLRGALIFFQFGGYDLASDGEPPQLRDYIFSLSAIVIGALHIAAVKWSPLKKNHT